MRPPIQSCGDWGQSQFQLGGDDESTYQILSYGLLFSTFYRFLYTADPLTCTTPMQPFTTFTQTFTQSPPTIPYTSSHHRPGTTSETFHTYDPQTTLLHFPFLVSFLLPNASFHSPTNHRSLHHAIRTLLYVSPHTNLVLVLLIICI